MSLRKHLNLINPTSFCPRLSQARERCAPPACLLGGGEPWRSGAHVLWSRFLPGGGASAAVPKQRRMEPPSAQLWTWGSKLKNSFSLQMNPCSCDVHSTNLTHTDRLKSRIIWKRGQQRQIWKSVVCHMMCQLQKCSKHTMSLVKEKDNTLGLMCFFLKDCMIWTPNIINTSQPLNNHLMLFKRKSNK